MIFKKIVFFLLMSSFLAVYFPSIARRFSNYCPYVGRSPCKIWTCPYNFNDGKYTKSCNKGA